MLAENPDVGHMLLCKATIFLRDFSELESQAQAKQLDLTYYFGSE
jgi:hypothetical protein